MNRFALPFLPLLLLVMIGCTDKAPKSAPKEEAKEQFVQTYDTERFKLFPTQNIYNFILLDKIDGKTWQVQWSFDEANRAVLPINRAVPATN